MQPTFMKSGIVIDWENFDPTQPFTIQCSSTAIDKIHHNPFQSTTEVYFQSGEEYEYYDIPITVLIQWMQSSSIGRYFNYHIRNNYSFAQVS